MARKILLADDSVTAQNMGRKILADAGYEVIAVNNGSAALKKIAEIKPDLVILDVYMPGYSGLEVCQRLKESPETARIPVLLTVGKLEPFKPEEAQRVRAEGYIVKPFEASELLSSLSKLEDKVVPRSEPSKPGRFARAIALAEEASQGRRSEAAGAGEGWPNRLGMPHTKTGPEEKVEDDPAIYNAINGDQRTAVDKPAGESAVEIDPRQEAAETNVDVGALAPAGLPKDVTAEELAAIAAAAAKIQMATSIVASADQESGSGFAKPESAAPHSEPIAAKAEDHLASEVAVGSHESMSDAAAAELAAESGHRRNGDSHSADIHSSQSEDVPVTMAAASQSHADSSSGVSRWTAVAVALEGNEASISLDHEMQKAHAALATAEFATSVSHAEMAQPTHSEIASPPEIDHSDAQAEKPVDAIANSYRELDSRSTSVPAQESAFSARAAELEAVPVAVPEPAADSGAFTAEPSGAYQIINSKPTEANVEANAAEPFGPAEQEIAASAAAHVSAESQEAAVASNGPEAAMVSEAAYSETQPMPEGGAAITESADAFAPIAFTPEASLEPDSVKTTAAAWASWRQIRDTGKIGETSAHSEDFVARESVPEDTNAKAVAAGAEQIDHAEAAAPAQNPSDVASIVDSVLADLRPKLMEEISRKMAEKK